MKLSELIDQLINCGLPLGLYMVAMLANNYLQPETVSTIEFFTYSESA